MGATIQPSPQAVDSMNSESALARGKVHAWLIALASRMLFGTLLLVLLMAPFEVGYPPLGRVLWTTYTNLEATLFLMGGAWLFLLIVDPAARLRLVRLPLILPMLALVAACLVSTFFGEYKSLGVQFTYRLLMGMLVLAVAWEALRSRRRLLIGMGMFVGAGTLAALIGLLEFVPWINVQPWLRVFKPQPTTVGGMLRLSGTFEYANGAAAFMEMAFPILLSLLVIFSLSWLTTDDGRRTTDDRREFASSSTDDGGEPDDSSAGDGSAGLLSLSHRRMQVLRVALYVALVAVTMALMLTFSRAAWLGVLAVLLVFGAAIVIVARRRSERASLPPVLRAFGLALIVMAVGGVYIYVTHPLLVLRLSSENDSGWYKNTIIPGNVPTLTASEFVTVAVTVRNDGPMLWHADRAPVVHLSYHWRQEGKTDYAVFEGERSPLPSDVAPNDSVTVEALVLTPPKPGTYQLEWDLVQEDVAWFYQKSRTRAESALLQILPSTGKAPVRPPQSSKFPPVSISEIENSDTSTVPRGDLWKAALAMFLDHPITGVGPDGFRNLYGIYAGKTEWNRNIYTNSTYIEMFTNLGLLGGLAFLWLVGLAFWRSARNLLHERVGMAWVIGMGATAALAAFLVHGVVDYFLFSTPLYIAFWFIMALTLCWYESSKFKVQSPTSAT